MGFRTTNILFSTVLTGPLYAFIVGRLIKWGTLGPVKDLNGGIRFLICVVAGFAIAFVMSVLIMMLNAKSRIQAQIQTEFEKNGYSDHYIEITQAEVNRLTQVGDTSQIYIGYVRNLTNAYLSRHNHDAAIATINLINPEELMKRNKNKPFDNYFMLQFFDIQMAICESLQDPNRAYAVMRDAMPYIESGYGKSNGADVVIDEIYVKYYCTIKDFNQAFVYADHALHKGDNRIFGYIGNLFYAGIYENTGEFDKAEEHIDIAESYTKKNIEKKTIEMARSELIYRKNNLIEN